MNDGALKKGNEMNQPNIEEITRSLSETMNPKVLLGELAPLSVQIMRLLAKGRPVCPEQIAMPGNITLDEAKDSFNKFQAMGMAELDGDGNIIGLMLSLNPTPHRFKVNGNELYTWCAIDALFLPAVLQRPAHVESTCPITKAEIRLAITPEGIEKADPSDLFLSIVVPGVTPGIDASCGPNCLMGSQGTFCGNVRFFSSHEVASTWLSNHEGAAILSLDEAYRAYA